MAFKIKRKPFVSQSNQYDSVNTSNQLGPASRGQDVSSADRVEADILPPNLFADLDRDVEPNLLSASLPQPSAAEHERLLALSTMDPGATPASTTSDHHSERDSEDDSRGPKEPSTESMPWGVHWHEPAFIIAMLLSGLAIALAHHFYYNSLKGETAGDAAKQAWPIRFGTAFAFLFVACLQAATAVSFAQYSWTVVRRKSLTISSLDKLFGLTGNPVGLMSLELLKNARIALLFGIVFWCLGFAGIAPPATLTVTTKNITEDAFVPMLNFSLPSWSANPQIWEPTSAPNKLALQAANSFDVVPLPRVVGSEYWSYDIQFIGPTLKCRYADDTEQPIFNEVTSSFESQDSIFTYSQVNDTYWKDAENSIGPTRLIYSAWVWPGMPNNVPNNWSPICDGCNKTGQLPIIPQIWVQTSSSSIVCSSVNATFDVTIASVGGAQQITQRNDVPVIGNGSYSFIKVAETEWGFEIGKDGSEPYQNTISDMWSIYFAHYFAVGAILQGNITLLDNFYDQTDDNHDYFNETMPFVKSPRREELGNATSNILSSGLVACDEIFNSPWKRLHSDANPEELSSGDRAEEESVTFNSTFPTIPGMCRNGSLLRGIEDLANNLTISMLSSSSLASPETTPINILTSNTINIYEYDPRYLFIPYGVALLFTLFATIAGLYSLHLNGVSHSVSFSSFLATTRNSDLDSLINGSSLGALPLKTDIEKTKLKFGPLLSGGQKHMEPTKEGRRDSGEQITPRVAFGLGKNVGQLKKGERYT